MIMTRSTEGWFIFTKYAEITNKIVFGFHLYLLIVEHVNACFSIPANFMCVHVLILYGALCPQYLPVHDL